MDAGLAQLVDKLKALDQEYNKKMMQMQQLEKEIRRSDTELKKKEQSVHELENTIKTLHVKQKHFDNEFQVIEQKVKSTQDKLRSLDEKAKEIISQGDNEIILNIGGTKFHTRKSTITSRKNMFYAMFSSGEYKPNKDGEYFFDRKPVYFRIILDYLRGYKIDWSKITDPKEFVIELDHYCIEIDEIDWNDFQKIQKIQKKIMAEREIMMKEHEQRTKMKLLMKDGEFLVDIDSKILDDENWHLLSLMLLKSDSKKVIPDNT